MRCSYSIPRRKLWRTVVLLFCVWAAEWVWAQEMVEGPEPAVLPDSPEPQADAARAADKKPEAVPAQNNVKKPDAGCKVQPPPNGSAEVLASSSTAATTNCPKKFDFFYPLGKPPAAGRLSSMDKLRIASSNVVDPFSLVTIGVSSAITIGSDSHTGYGPGMGGWAKNAGTLFTEDMTGAFFITFLIPSIVKQDPRYYRMPHASIPRRIENAIMQPVWTRSDSGKHMPNLAMLIGVPATITLANVYVPDKDQGVGPTAASSAIAIASSPIDNFVTEFLPDVAKVVKIRIVIIQRLINHIAVTGGEQ